MIRAAAIATLLILASCVPAGPRAPAGDVLAGDVAAGDGCYEWPLREPLAYDGDTLYALLPGLPTELREISVRVRGIDAPELRGRCAREIVQAEAARAETARLLRAGRWVEMCAVGWDKYGGRVDARVMIDGRDLGQALIAAGLARPYEGDRREGWCD